MHPAYRRIIADITDDIANGALKPGDRLPSTAELCSEYQVSQTVVHQAMLLLAASGTVVGKPGLGRFVAARN